MSSEEVTGSVSSGANPQPVDGAISAESPNITEATFQQVRDLIVHGRLAPGSRIVEADLAERLGVSRTPIRGALNRLRQEGYIVASGNAGSKVKLSVAPLTKEDAAELYVIVSHLEGLAARLSANLDAESRSRLTAHLQSLNQELAKLAAAGRGDPNLIFDLDRSFHQAIVDASAGPRLRVLHSSIKPQTERYWRLYASAIVDRLDISVREHIAVIQALDSGDADAAERALQVNWQHGSVRLGQVIDTLGERGSW